MWLKCESSSDLGDAPVHLGGLAIEFGQLDLGRRRGVRRGDLEHKSK